MYACICHAVTSAEVAEVVRGGAATEEAVGRACGAGTGCGSCIERIDELLGEEAGVDTRVGATR